VYVKVMSHVLLLTANVAGKLS